MPYGKVVKGMAEKKSDWQNWEQTQRFEMIIPVSLLRLVDDWRKHQPSAPNRSEAIRRLVEAGLRAKPKER